MLQELKNEVKKPAVLFLIGYVLLCALLQQQYVGALKSLPSPLYGGDLYYQMGAIEHIRSGGSVLESSSMVGTTPGYLPAYGVFVAAISWLLNTDTFHGMLACSMILLFATYALWYFVLREICGDESMAVLGAIIVNVPPGDPVFKYTAFAMYFVTPIALYFFWRAWKSEELKDYAMAGIVYGLLPLCHMVLFIGMTILAALLFGIKIYRNKEYASFGALKKYAVFALIAAPLLMLYWYQPIFEYHLKFAYDRTHMELPDFGTLGVQLWFFSDIWARITSKIGLVIASAFVLLGFRKIKWDGFEGALFIASLLATFSYFITEPLLKMNFIPQYLSIMMLLPSIVVLSLGCAKEVLGGWKSGKLVLYLLLLVLAGSAFLEFQDRTAQDKWIKVGMNQTFPEEYLGLRSYLVNNTGVDDVFLSTKEVSFALNAFSGRKLVVNRWAHQNNQYLDMPGRDRDAAVMLYGKNASMSVALMKSYEVKYVFWHAYWYNSEFIFDSSGKPVDWYDPLITMNTDANRKMLDENGVKYREMKFWLDPSGRSSDIRKYDILQVSYENYDFSGNGPWNDGLDQYLEEVWSYEENGQKYAALYKVKY
ncbi:MAG: glycosyltransferase family 39 protein [Candidatus Micrarchaeia archaeon]